MKYLVLALLLVLVGCGNMENRKTNYSGTTECVDDNCTSVFDVNIRKADRVINQRQIIPNYRKCLSLSTSQVSSDTVNAHSEVTTSLSKDGEVKEISSAMMISITKVASQICTDLINYEKTSLNRNYFMGYTLGGTGDSAQTFSLDKMLSKFANNCWGRDVTTTERQFFDEKINNDFGKNAKGALMLCTTILSSADAIRY